MAVIFPFRAVRPRKEYVSRVASHPYDVMTSDEARNIAKRNPMSFLRVTKAEIDLPAGTNPYGEDVYRKARQNFEGQLKEGILFQDERPAFYVYCQRTDNHEQCGIGACVHVTEFVSGNVRRHEMTLPEKERDRKTHIDIVNAQTGPIFLTYKSRDEINRIVRRIRKGEPEYCFDSDEGIRHSLWVVNDGDDVREIEKAFRRVKILYIADGHHRAASGVAVAGSREEKEKGGYCSAHNLILAVLFPHTELNIREYNRIVKDLGGLKESDFLRKVEEKFALEPDFREKSPGRPREYGMYLKGKWYRLGALEGSCKEDDAVGALDASILQENLLGPILGILDPRGDSRIRFVGGSRGVEELERLVDSGEYAVAFTLYPPTVSQMMKIADAGRVMPPKSTWFEPKLMDGIMIHRLDDEDAAAQ